MKRTIPALLQKALTENRSAPAYLAEEEGGRREVTWEEVGRRVEDLAFGLLALGIEQGDVIGIMAATRLEWTLVDFALARIGAVTAPIYATSSAGDAAYMLGLVEAKGVFVDAERRELVPALPHVLSLDALDELEEQGRAYREQHPGALAEVESRIDEEDLYTFIYTSGTTGAPKACMIRHRNYFEMAATIDALDEFTLDQDLVLLYLPLAHNYGRLLVLLGAYEGYTIAFLADPYATADALPQVRPTVLPSVPRLYEKVHTRIKGQFDSARGVRRRLIDWALAVGREALPYKLRDEPLPRGLARKHRIADRLVYSKVKDRLGGRLRVAISGGAPLAPEIAEFFLTLDILIIEGYGLSECTTACSVNLPGHVKFGTVGRILPGFEVKTSEDGEILIRSQTVFAGYYNDEEATREAIDADGWLHSGDIGEIDEDGYLRITDRKKDIIVTAGGKNLAPQSLENALKSAKLISQALVVGDRRPYVVALISLDEDEVDGISPEEAQTAVQRIVDDVNRNRSRFEQIKRFAIVPRDFSADEGEVTPTMKLKRRIVEQHFADEIEKLYAA
jgi:long-chain acyl-CoA synthetase